MTINTNQSSPALRLVGNPALTQPTRATSPTINQRAARVADSIDLQSLKLTNRPSKPTAKPATEIDPKPITAPTPKARQANNAKLVANIVEANTLETHGTQPAGAAPSQIHGSQPTGSPTTPSVSSKKISLQAAAAIRFYQSPADQTEAFTTARALDVRA